MNLWHNFITPKTVSDALLALRDAPGPSAPIAGGTDLILDLGQGRRPATTTLVDLTSVAEMTAIEPREGRLFIGASAPLARIADHPLVAQHAEGLVEACRLIGGPQVRNVATLGGNVAHALPAADGTIALLALDARAEIANLDARRRVSLGELFEGPGKSALQQGRELIVGFWLPFKGHGEGSAFKRIMRPQGVALPILNLAVWMACSGESIVHARVAVGPAGPTPRRAFEVEHAVVGRPLSADSCRQSEAALLQHVIFRSSPRRATSDYRRRIAGSLLRDALSCAWRRAKNEH